MGESAGFAELGGVEEVLAFEALLALSERGAVDSLQVSNSRKARRG